MAYDGKGRRLISNSEIETYMECPRRWWLAYVRALTPVREEKVGCAHTGTLIHDGLADYYGGAAEFSIEKVRELMEARQEKEVLEAHGAGDVQRASQLQKAHDLAIAVVLRYLNWAEESGVDSGMTFQRVEKEMRLELTDFYTLRGKIDLLAHFPETRTTAVLDHKSAKDFSAETWAHNRAQFLGYAILVEATEGLDVRAVMVNIVRRVLSPKTDPQRRVEVPINKEQLRTHKLHLQSWARRMEQAEADLQHSVNHHVAVPPHWTKDCSWKCQFFSVCPMFDRGDDAEYVLATEYEQHDPDARYGEGE